MLTSIKATVQVAIGTIPMAMGLKCGEIVLTAAVVCVPQEHTNDYQYHGLIENYE